MIVYSGQRISADTRPDFQFSPAHFIEDAQTGTRINPYTEISKSKVDD
jgi:hypothetical protein